MKLPDFLKRENDGWVHVVGHRIGIENLVYLYSQGYSPEMLAGEYPTLSLAEIHKTLAFYLENRQSVDEYITSCNHEIEKRRAVAPPNPSLEELRQRSEASRGVESA